MAAASSSTTAPPLGKYLASTDKKTRDKAIKNLAIFLSDPERDALPKNEMAKLWKGIFYCFWMSDKPLVQQALASELAEILLKIPQFSVSLAFLRGFWEATVREWGGIDRLRIDKYYMLVRRFVNASFRLLIRHEWDEAKCAEYSSILTDQGGPLCPTDKATPISLAYHLADIYLEELDKIYSPMASEEDPERPPPAPLVTLLIPFFTLAARTPNKNTLQRIQSALLEPLFDTFAHVSESLEDSSDNEEVGRQRKRRKVSQESPLPHLDGNACLVNSKEEGIKRKKEVRDGLLKRLFDMASEEETRDANRRKMYALWKTYSQDETA